MPSIKVAFIKRIPPNNEAKKAEALASFLQILLQCSPSHHEKVQEISLQSDQIRELKNRIKKEMADHKKDLANKTAEIEKLQKDFNELKSQPREVHHYHEKIIERDGGCVIF